MCGLLCFCVVALVVGCFLWPVSKPINVAENLRLARQSLSQKQFEKAEQLAIMTPPGHPRWTDAMLIAGEAATRTERLEAAKNYYQSVPLTASQDAVLARFSLAEIYLHVGALTKAEQAFRDVLTKEPNYVEARSRLSFLLDLTGRRFESGDELFPVLRSGAATLDELILFADLERPLDSKEFLKKCQQQTPGDLLIRLGLGVGYADEGNGPAAISALQDVLKVRPDLLAAQSLLGELLLDEGREDFLRWHRALPPEADSRQEIWFVRGLWARKSGQLEMAAKCFWQTLNQNPMHRRANYQLGIVLAQLGIPTAGEFSNRSKQLFDLSAWLTHVRESRGTNETAMKEVVASMESLGRIWETCAWANVCRSQFPNATWRTSAITRLSPLLGPALPVVLSDNYLSRKVDVSSFADFKLPDVTKPTTRNTAENDSGQIRFEATANMGLDFIYENGNDESTPGARIQEQTGGGASVFDIDGDNWPDLYLVQGGKWNHGSMEYDFLPEYFDRIFRNRRGMAFEDITSQCGLKEYGFGQSCAVGDINNDGFADLYVANIGTNTVYLNNGDGTFQLAVASSIQQLALFTSSTAISDINGDGNPDLFDVNYVTGENVYHLICSGRACSPSAFDGVTDRLHLSRGDGTFDSLEASTPQNDSKGLGVVVAKLEEGAQPSLFISNDQTPNFLLTITEPANGSPLELVDQGFRSGVAYNKDGLLTAAMGIAADDIDGNGLTDFFITNFQDESNVLYMQLDKGFFSDSTRSSGLQTPSIQFVGWGTQFLDADLDGQMDLVLTNGHVDSYPAKDIAPEMRCQFFQNQGDAIFKELFADELGPFFDRPYYGRGLSKLDWNRDGLVDFVMTPIRSPVALVTNTTSTGAHYINIRLHGTTAARDATHAFVEVITATGSWKKQLLAGDGYHASNERVLQFGLGETDQIEKVVITWPLGGQTNVERPPVDSTLEAVEGMQRVTAWKNHVVETLDADVTRAIQTGKTGAAQ